MKAKYIIKQSVRQVKGKNANYFSLTDGTETVRRDGRSSRAHPRRVHCTYTYRSSSKQTRGTVFMNSPPLSLILSRSDIKQDPHFALHLPHHMINVTLIRQVNIFICKLSLGCKRSLKFALPRHTSLQQASINTFPDKV